MLSSTRRRILPASLLVTGVLAAGSLAGATTADALLSPSASLTAASTPTTSITLTAPAVGGGTVSTLAQTTGRSTTATTNATFPAGTTAPVVRTQAVRRSSRVTGTSVRRTAARNVVTVRVSVTSIIKATATMVSRGRRSTEVRTSRATRTSSHSVVLRTTRAEAARHAAAVAVVGARRLADHVAASAASSAAVTAVRRSAAGTSPAPAPAPPAPANANAMPHGNLPGWRQVFADDFSTTVGRGSFLGTYGSRWSAYGPGWKDTSGHGVYDANKTMSAAGGLLDIYLHTENGVHYVAAPTPKLPSMTYGRFSIRFQADSMPGYKAAWLLWPNDNVWPAHGETDFPEGDFDSNFSAFSHYASSGGGQAPFTLSARFTSWHTATIDWLPGKIVFYLDGKVVGTTTKLVPNQPMHWVLQNETALSSSAPSSSVSGHVRIDWVTAYAYAP